MRKFFIPTTLPTEVILSTFDKSLGKILWLVFGFMFGLLVYKTYPIFSNSVYYIDYEVSEWWIAIFIGTLISAWIAMSYQTWIDKSYDLDKDS